MEQVPYTLPGAVATYSAKSALFTAGYADRGTFFDSTGSFTITLDTTSMSAGWSAWFRTVSGTQTFDPSGAVTINGAATYAVSNAGDVVLVEFDGTNFVISHTQRPSTVAITGGTINGTTVGATTAAAGTFTTATISTATGTTLTVSSTNAAAIACAGGATFANATAATAASTGAVQVTGGIYAGAECYLGDMVTIGKPSGNAGSATRILNLQNGTGGIGIRYTCTSGTKYNWLFGGQLNIDNGFEITPSTATGGTTFSNPAFQIAGATGLVTLPAAGSTGLTIAKTTGTTLTVSSTDASNSVSLAGGMTIASGMNLRMGTANVPVTGTTGFLYIPVTSGAPTGTPTTLAGTAPLVIDSNANKLYFYSGGAWRDAGP